MVYEYVRKSLDKKNEIGYSLNKKEKGEAKDE